LSAKRKNQYLDERDKEGNGEDPKSHREGHEPIHTNVTTNPDVSMVTFPLEQCIPLEAIP